MPSRFDDGTVYVTLDGHRQNDYETYIYASTTSARRSSRSNGNLKGEVARTLTEDMKTPDVLYVGTETGLFVSIDRGASWQRIKANLPTVRIDEITLHPRDNAMILATHGRARSGSSIISSRSRNTPGAANDRRREAVHAAAVCVDQRPARDRNYEFWGDQTFFGQNPPQAAVLSWFNKKQVGDVKLKITDAGGREVREISGQVSPTARSPASSRPAGTCACSRCRIPILGQRRPRPGWRTGPRGRTPGRRRRAAARQVDPFGAGCGGGGGGFGGGSAAAAVVAATPVRSCLPGVYNVALVVDGKTSRPSRCASWPTRKWSSPRPSASALLDMAMELHGLQKRANDVVASIVPVGRQLPEVKKQVESKTDLPADVKAQFEAFEKEFTALPAKLVPPAGGGRGGGGGGGGGGADPARSGGSARRRTA